MNDRTYLCIDAKSFYASIECVERGLDPLTTNLVVADISRTEKTICLAVTPSLKAYGISGRARLFEVIHRVREVNAQRRIHAPGRTFSGSSSDDTKLRADPTLELDYIVAPPRMALYIDYSTRIYNVYLKYFAPEDIYPYSIDEIFLDITNYLDLYHLSTRELTKKIILDVLQTTGITTTAGMGTNLYLSKVAMDIVAKHIKPDQDGVRIAKLDEHSYRRLLWAHRPLTDFWRVGRGYAQKLESRGLRTMGDIARCSLHNEAMLYRLFGVNAELLIDHAWGYEPCTMADIKAYRPQDHSILIVGYDRASNTANYQGELTKDYYGRSVPKHAHGSINLPRLTSSGKLIVNAAVELYERIVDPELLIRRLNIVANHTTDEANVPQELDQLDLFTPLETKQKEAESLARERSLQETMLKIQSKYGKNAILKANSLQDGATAMERNRQIGGHRA